MLPEARRLRLGPPQTPEAAVTDRHRLWNRLVYYFTSEEVENMRPHKGKPDTRPTVHPHPTGVQAGLKRQQEWE